MISRNRHTKGLASHTVVSRDEFYDAWIRVTRKGHHVSLALKHLFRADTPGSSRAAAIRHRMFQALRYNNWKSAWDGELDAVCNPANAYVPEWLAQQLSVTTVSQRDAIIASWLTDAPTFVRVNTIRCTAEQCTHALAPFKPEQVSDTCIRIDAPYGLFSSDAFRHGWFEQQDVNSQRVCTEIVRAVPISSISLWTDLCAGAGGKTLHASALMNNQGRILAMDVHQDKLTELRRRATGAGVTNVETRLITSGKILKRIYGKSDVVLVDAPCSGTGVLRRNPDILYHHTADTIDELRSVQTELLNRAVSLCTPGGLVAYTTCSTLPAEGPDQVGTLTTGNRISVVNEWSTYQGQDGGDGFYSALMRVP